MRERRDARGAAAQNLARHPHQVAHHGHAGGSGTRAAAVVEGVLAVGPLHPDGVIRAAHAGQNGGLRNQRRTHRQDQPLRRLARRAQQSNGVAEAVGVLEIHRREAANPLGENVRRRDLLAESQRGKDGQLRARVEAIDIVARVGLGVPQPLRLGQHGFERRAVLLHLGEDVVAGAVEDAVAAPPRGRRRCLRAARREWESRPPRWPPWRRWFRLRWRAPRSRRRATPSIPYSR